MLQETDPDNFESWESYIKSCETLDGGLNRNSSPQALATFREAYDHFLHKFPLLFGYWKKYADMEFNIAGPESAEMVWKMFLVAVLSCIGEANESDNRFTSEVVLVSPTRSICGPTIALSRWKLPMILKLCESKYCLMVYSLNLAINAAFLDVAITSRAFYRREPLHHTSSPTCVLVRYAFKWPYFNGDMLSQYAPGCVVEHYTLHSQFSLRHDAACSRRLPRLERFFFVC